MMGDRDVIIATPAETSQDDRAALLLADFRCIFASSRGFANLRCRTKTFCPLPDAACLTCPSARRDGRWPPAALRGSPVRPRMAKRPYIRFVGTKAVG
jgi:hypothetical protein